MNTRPWHKNYDEGVPTVLDYPEIVSHVLLEKAAEIYGDKVCTIFNGATISYREMNDVTDQLAAGLHGLGIKKGDRVGVFIPNTPQFVMAYYGLLKIGAIVVATNPLYTEREIIYQAKDSGMKAMVCMTNNYEKIKSLQGETDIKQIVATNIKEALPPIKRVLFGLLKEKKAGFRATLRDGDVWMQDLIQTHKPEDRPDVEITPDDTALFQYSGGTTGVSKGVIATHRGLVANTFQIDAWNPQAVEGEEVILMAIPLYHAYGMVVGLNNGVKNGYSLVMVPDPRNTDDVLKNLTKYNATIYPGVPAMYNAINNHPDVISGKVDLSTVSFCISGSAPLMRETKEAFEKFSGGKLVEGYGLSEAPVASHCNPMMGENKTGSIGMPMPDVDCKIVDLEYGVTEMLPSEQGELIMKGPMLMKGYHNMPEETNVALRDGWLFTGDIGYMDEDGYFYIVDRKKELIKVGGLQVWPREVEEVIKEMPQVLEVGAAGVPDADSGEVVKAWIVLKEGKNLTLEEVREYCQKDLAGYKVPKHVAFIDELPKTPVGKTLRRKLVELG